MERALCIAALPAMGFALMWLCYGVIDGAMSDWSGARLAPLVAMWRGLPHGYRLYQDAQSGVMNGWVYGPVPALLMIPAAIWSSPTPALLTGAAINALFTLAPIVWILCRVAGRASSETRSAIWPFVAAGTCLLILLIGSQESMQIVSFQITADGAALGFAAAACAVILHNRTRTLNLLLMSLFCSLAVWSKQTLAPFAIVPLLFLWLTEGARVMFRAAAILLCAGLLLSVPLVAAFGWRNMWFNMVTLPGTHPWASNLAPPNPIVIGLHVIGRLLLESCQPLSILILIFAIVRFIDPGRLARARIRQLLISEPWLILLLAALVMAPAALMGYSIVGGYVNHLALSVYFLDGAAVAALTSIAVRFHRAPLVGGLARCSGAALLTLLAGGIALQPNQFQTMAHRIANPRDNVQQRIYEFALAHPGQVYFPWYPLPALLAEGKLYHFQWGLIDHQLASVEISSAQLSAHLPQAMQYVACTDNPSSRLILQAFPVQMGQTRSAALPDMTLVRVMADPIALGAPQSQSELAREVSSP